MTILSKIVHDYNYGNRYISKNIGYFFHTKNLSLLNIFKIDSLVKLIELYQTILKYPQQKLTQFTNLEENKLDDPSVILYKRKIISNERWH